MNQAVCCSEGLAVWVGTALGSVRPVAASLSSVSVRIPDWGTPTYHWSSVVSVPCGATLVRAVENWILGTDSSLLGIYLDFHILVYNWLLELVEGLFKVSLKYQWLNATLWYLQWISNGDTIILHQITNILVFKWLLEHVEFCWNTFHGREEILMV